MQNEANFRVTEVSHYSNVPSFHRSNPMPSVQNEAKLGQDGTSGGSARREEAGGAKRTQFGPRRSEGKYIVAKRLGAIRRKRGMEKQTQFPAGRDTPPFHYSIIPSPSVLYET